MIILAGVFCLLLAALAGFQAALLAGAPLGEYAWGGQHRVLPRRLRIGSAVAIVLYLLFAVITRRSFRLREIAFSGMPSTR